MGDLREIIEGDLYETLEGDYGLPVELLSPTDGLWQTKSVNHPDDDLSGQIFYETITLRPDTTLDLINHKPWVALRRSSLREIPSDTNYKEWVVKIPILPSETAPKVSFRIHRPPEGGGSIGFIRLYLEKIEQS